jgi:hypothetical protein
VDLERALVPSKFAPERAQMVVATGHQGREPSTRLVHRLVELHREIDIADLECAARIGAKGPDLAHPWQVSTLAVCDALEETSIRLVASERFT